MDQGAYVETRQHTRPTQMGPIPPPLSTTNLFFHVHYNALNVWSCEMRNQYRSVPATKSEFACLALRSLHSSANLPLDVFLECIAPPNRNLESDAVPGAARRLIRSVEERTNSLAAASNWPHTRCSGSDPSLPLLRQAEVLRGIDEWSQQAPA